MFNHISFYKTSFSEEFLADHRYGAEFNYSTINGYVRFMDCKMSHLSLKQTNILERAQFELCKIGRLVYKTTTYGLLTFIRCDINDGNFEDQDCSHLVFRRMENLGNLNFTGAELRETSFILGNWEKTSKPESGKQRIKEQSNRDRVENLKSREFQYRQLNKLYEDTRHYRQAGKFHLLEMQTRKERLDTEEGQFWDRFILWVYGSVADYGENWQKLFAVLLGSFFLIAFLITCIEIWNCENGLFVTLLFEKYWFYLKAVFLGIIPSGFQRMILSEAGLSVYSQFLIALQAIISLTLTTLFVMAIRRRFRR